MYCFQTWQDLRSKAKSKNITLIRAFEPGDKPNTPEVAIPNPPDQKTFEPVETSTNDKSYVELDDTQVEFDFVDLETLPTTGCSESKTELYSTNIEVAGLPLIEELPIASQETSVSTPTKRNLYQRYKHSSKLPGVFGHRSKTNSVNSDNSQFHANVIDLLTKHVECTQNYHDKNLTLLMKQVEFKQNYQMQKLAILTRLAEAKELTKSKTN